MAYGPVNARSELVTPKNFSGGGVFEITRMFQDASAAFISPARRPTRGSGLGATVDMLAPPDDAHAARAHNPRVRTTRFMVDSREKNGRGVERASSACARSRWSGQRTRRKESAIRCARGGGGDRTADSPS